MSRPPFEAKMWRHCMDWKPAVLTLMNQTKLELLNGLRRGFVGRLRVIGKWARRSVHLHGYVQGSGSFQLPFRSSGPGRSRYSSCLGSVLIQRFSNRLRRSVSMPMGGLGFERLGMWRLGVGGGENFGTGIVPGAIKAIHRN